MNFAETFLKCVEVKKQNGYKQFMTYRLSITNHPPTH